MPTATRSPPSPPAAPGAARYGRLDALRGAAIVWMALFHFGFDLAHFRLIAADFKHDPLWTTQRTLIVSLFLFCAGMGQAIATAHGQGWARFWRRWAQVAGCALLVSAGSALMFPRSWIAFGVLHGIAVMLLIARLTAGWEAWLWPLGALAIALPQLLHLSAFDAPALQWIGLGTRRPVTEDWVPILPWLGVLWWGLASGRWLLRHRPAWLQAPPPAAARPLALLGRWSLTFYMLHQPVLIGALLAWRALAS